MKTSAHKGDWQTLVTTTDWITEASKNKEVPWFAFQGMNIVHPPYHTDAEHYARIPVDEIVIPEWPKLGKDGPVHPCGHSWRDGLRPSDRRCHQRRLGQTHSQMPAAYRLELDRESASDSIRARHRRRDSWGVPRRGG